MLSQAFLSFLITPFFGGEIFSVFSSPLPCFSFEFECWHIFASLIFHLLIEGYQYDQYTLFFYDALQSREEVLWTNQACGVVGIELESGNECVKFGRVGGIERWLLLLTVYPFLCQ